MAAKKTTKKTTSSKKASTSKTKRPASKKTAAKKAPAKKAPAKQAAGKKKATTSKPARKLSPSERYRITEEEAYYIAERSGFRRDNADCWIEAEAAVKKKYGA